MSDPWSGIYGALIGLIGSGVIAALVTYRLSLSRASAERIEEIFISLARAVERFKVAVVLDHWRIATFQEGDHEEYQRANADLNIAITTIVLCISESVRADLIGDVSTFQKEANRHIEARNEEHDEENKRALNSGRPRLITPEWIAQRKQLHASVENDIQGRAEGLQFKIRMVAEQQKRAVIGFWQIWRW